MQFDFGKDIALAFLSILIISHPIKTTEASLPFSHAWVEVPKSQFGEQVWDKSSFHRNPDGSVRILSKFIPKNGSEITQAILYTMDINCSQYSFRDIAVGAREFNEFSNKDAEWKNPNGDKLILGVIHQVCNFEGNGDITSASVK